MIILLVNLEIAILRGILSRTSSMITISEDSIAASLPILPIEIPTVARARDGASLIPSPTKATCGFFDSSSFKRLYLSCGSKL